MSTERPVNGGSPQGSILGNFLFCVCSDELDRALEDNEELPTSHAGQTPVPETALSASLENTSPGILNVDPELARIVTEEPSELGINNITVLRSPEDLCVPFNRNGTAALHEGQRTSTPRPADPLSRVGRPQWPVRRPVFSQLGESLNVSDTPLDQAGPGRPDDDCPGLSLIHI